MTHPLESCFYSATFEGLSSLSAFKTMGPETEIWTFVRVSKLVQFILPHSTSLGAETE